MNKAIVICYQGENLSPETAQTISQLIAVRCNTTPEITIKVFDEDSIAKALLRSAEDLKISFENDKKEANIIAEARQRAVSLIKSKYNSLAGVIAFAKDVAIAKYHLRVNAADADQIDLLNAIDVIADIPQSQLITKHKISKSLCDAIFQLKDM